MPEWMPVTRGDMTSLLHAGWHYIRNGDGIEELYRLSSDPGEVQNMAGSESGADVLAEIRAILASLNTEGP